MKESWKFIFILFITLILLSIYSFTEHEIKIAGLTIKKTKIKEFFVGDTIPTYCENILFHNKATTKKKKEMDSSEQRILLIGDSMLEQLRWRVRDYAEENGHKMWSVIWYSSQSEYYGQSDTLTYFINLYKPTYILMVLGANELFVDNITTKRAAYVKRIVEQMDTIPFVWIGPPNWKDDTGINKLILKYAGTKQYYPSYKVTQTPLFKRYADGAHPKPESASRWFDSTAVWIMKDSEHPIILNLPKQKGKSSPNTTMLQPLK